MASYLETLLAQREPLEGHEVTDLERWLGALRDDVETFGATPEDEARMASIQARIEAERGVVVSP